MNEESEENDEENTNLVESLEVNFTTETDAGWDVLMNKLLQKQQKNMEERVAMNQGIKTLTDKEVADYLSEKNPLMMEQIYRALHKGSGPINSSEMIPPPLPLKFMTRALTADVELIIINWSGGSDEGHLSVNVEDWNGKSLSLWGTDLDPLLRALLSDIEEWCYDAMDYGGAGDGNSYGDIIRYNLKEGTVSTEHWWTEEVHGGEGFDTMETC